jgi:hypothetical protein
MYVDAIKAKTKLLEPTKKSFKELECILQGKLITARLNCAHPVTSVKSSRLAGASLKSHLRQDKLSAMFHLAALHPSLKSSCSICNQQLPKLNTVFPKII